MRVHCELNENAAFSPPSFLANQWIALRILSTLMKVDLVVFIWIGRLASITFCKVCMCLCAPIFFILGTRFFKFCCTPFLSVRNMNEHKANEEHHLSVFMISTKGKQSSVYSHCWFRKAMITVHPMKITTAYLNHMQILHHRIVTAVMLPESLIRVEVTLLNSLGLARAVS